MTYFYFAIRLMPSLMGPCSVENIISVISVGELGCVFTHAHGVADTMMPYVVLWKRSFGAS